MHAMFIHPAFPGPFAAVAHYLKMQLHWDCTYVTHVDTGKLNLSFTHINYRLKEDVPSPAVFTNPDDLNGLLEHLAAIYRGLRRVPQIKPDLVVGHTSFGTLLYLRNLYPCPFVGYFELYPGQFWNDGLVLRKEFPPTEVVRLANATYHALTLLQLQAVDAAYTPTQTQLATCPAEYRHKIRVIPEGVDCQIFQPRPRPAKIGDATITPETRVITYVSRGLESVRGFDVFMRLAKRIAERRPDVLFVVVGAERTNHGHEMAHLGGMSFKQWVLSQDNYDLSKFVFLGAPSLEQLNAAYNASDLHVHLSVPYVPSPSILQAMASGCAILGSATAPVQEFIEDGVHGKLVDFYDVDAMTEKALELLTKPDQAKRLGREARLHVLESYEANQCVRRLGQFLEEFTHGGAPAKAEV
jgi:glycosyltransferase involved in cell wall biosynthesis